MGKYYWKAITIALGGVLVGLLGGWMAFAPAKDERELLKKRREEQSKKPEGQQQAA